MDAFPSKCPPNLPAVYPPVDMIATLCNKGPKWRGLICVPVCFYNGKKELLRSRIISNTQFKTFAEFYPYYLGEHSDKRSRILHYTGSILVLSIGLAAVLAGPLWLLALMPLCGYFFAWIGHFFVEKNSPATFKHPIWSLMGDFKMLWQAITGTLDKRHFD